MLGDGNGQGYWTKVKVKIDEVLLNNHGGQ